MTLEWLRTWLYSIIPGTAEKNVQELSLPYDSDDDDDSASIATLETAFEQHDNTGSIQEQISTPKSNDYSYYRVFDTDDRQVIIQGNRWPQLIEEYGRNPGASVGPGPVEVFDLHLTFSSPYLSLYRRCVEEFSGAQVTIYDRPPAPYTHCLRLTGTIENAFYAIKAYNAILDTTTIPDRKVWVTLTLKGPKLVAMAEALKERLRHILPEDGFIPADNLHVTIGLVDPEPRCLTHKKLYQVLESMVAGLNRTNFNRSAIGYYNQVRVCNPSRISMGPRDGRDPISIASRAFRRALEDYGFDVDFTYRPHMTVYHSKLASPKTLFSVETLRTLDVVPDFGPLNIRSVVISDSVQTLSGIKYVTLAEIPLENCCF